MLGNLTTTDGITATSASSRSMTRVGARSIVVQDDTGLFRAVRYLPFKRLMDLAFCTALAVMLGPVIVVTALLVRITSPGPSFYTQTRLGRLARPFVIWKIRTMTHNCEKTSGPQWSVRGDSRVTTLGRILRRLHVDEFPQLWNVFTGEMSLVGPRPERPEFFPMLESTVPNYSKRMLMKPGVTGLAQAYLPPDEDVESVRLKQIFDLYYIRHAGFWFDVRILVATALQAVGFPHGLVRRSLLLPHPKTIETTPTVHRDD